MTSHKSFKQRVRARMDKTGESYSAARAQLLPREQEPDAGPTGRSYSHWFAALDEWGAIDRSHTEIAAWLTGEQGVQGWWAQNITVEYERARGLREKGQGRDGFFTANASKTVAVAVEELFAAVVEPARRDEWLPGVVLRERTATPHKSARYDWGEGSTRVIVGFETKASGKSVVALSHERLPDSETAATMRAFWRERLSGLKALLEAR